MKKIVRIAAKLLVLAIVAVAITIAMQNTHGKAATTTARTMIYTQDNFHKPVVKPKTVWMDDGTEQDRRMAWKIWTATKAVTSAATLRDCGGRTCVYDKARVTLYAPAGKAGHRYFTMMWVHLLKSGATYQFRYAKQAKQASSPVWGQTFCSIHDSC